MPSGSSTPTTTHHHDIGIALHTNFHAVNNSQPHDNVASERIMSQSNSDSDPESTDEREEEPMSNTWHIGSTLDIGGTGVVGYGIGGTGS